MAVVTDEKKNVAVSAGILSGWVADKWHRGLDYGGFGPGGQLFDYPFLSPGLLWQLIY